MYETDQVPSCEVKIEYEWVWMSLRNRRQPVSNGSSAERASSEQEKTHATVCVSKTVLSLYRSWGLRRE